MVKDVHYMIWPDAGSIDEGVRNIAREYTCFPHDALHINTSLHKRSEIGMDVLLRKRSYHK